MEVFIDMSSSLLSALVLVCALLSVPGWSQDQVTTPLSYDPTFWASADKPYMLELSVTSSHVEGGVPRTHTSKEIVSRDSAGLVRTEDFYDSGAPSAITIRDARKQTIAIMQVVTKRAWILPQPGPSLWIKAWRVERLAPRVIDGYSAEGLRFVRTVPESDDHKRKADTVIEEDWISSDLKIILERKVDSQLTGTKVETVFHFRQVEPDPSLFTLPNDYTLQQNTASASH